MMKSMLWQSTEQNLTTWIIWVWRKKKKERNTWRLSHKSTALSTIILCAGVFTYLLKYNPFRLVVTILKLPQQSCCTVHHHFTLLQNHPEAMIHTQQFDQCHQASIPSPDVWALSQWYWAFLFYFIYFFLPEIHQVGNLWFKHPIRIVSANHVIFLYPTKTLSSDSVTAWQHCSRSSALSVSSPLQ